MKSIIILILVTLAVGTLGHGAGAPATQAVCESLAPDHGVGAQQGPSPFSIVASHNTARPGETIKITLTTSGGRSFRGFYVQARSIGADFQVLGQFESYASENSPFHFRNCREGVNNSVTHANNQNKQNMSFLWRVPANFRGQMRFQ